MSNENNTIHDFDMQLLCEFFSHVERQGPGSPEATLRALDFVSGLTDEVRIADVGCGTGGQTMVLASRAPGQITGIDLFPAFIEKFNRQTVRLGLAHRVKGMAGTMEQLPFADGELDLIWSEGAIYNIGYERGLNEWRRFLKPGGYIAVTESSWFTDKRPQEIQDFWDESYPEINTIPVKVAQMQQAGYCPVASFVLPECCWTDHYYKPLEGARRCFLERYPGNATIEQLVAFSRREEALYDKYKAYYGYVFYIGRKV